MTAGSGFRRKEGRDGGINRKKWAGRRDLRTLIVNPHITVYNCKKIPELSKALVAYLEIYS